MGKHEFLSCGAFFEKRIEIHLSYKIRTTKKKEKKKDLSCFWFNVSRLFFFLIIKE